MLVPKKDDNPVRMVIPIYRWACNHSWKVTTCEDLCPSKELQHLPNVVTCNPSRRVIHVHQRLHRFTKSHTFYQEWQLFEELYSFSRVATHHQSILTYCEINHLFMDGIKYMRVHRVKMWSPLFTCNSIYYFCRTSWVSYY